MNSDPSEIMFPVAAGLILAEGWRSSRSQSRRREGVDDRIDDLENKVGNLVGLVELLGEQMESLATDVRIEGARYVTLFESGII
jgi:Optic atrophy 3 protein (OPA3)